MMVFHLSLSDSMSPQVSRTLLCILADLSNAVVWKVSTSPFIFKRTSGDHPNYCITEIGQNTEKSPGDLRRFSVAQTPAIIHSLELFTLAIADGFSLESERQQVSSSL